MTFKLWISTVWQGLRKTPGSLAYVLMLWGGFGVLWWAEGFLTAIAVLLMIAASNFGLDNRLIQLEHKRKLEAELDAIHKVLKVEEVANG